MPSRTFPIRRYLAGLIVLALAHVYHPGSPAAVEQQTAAPDERVIAFAFGTIKERYLTEVPMSDLASTGLNGLSVIDPAIAVEQDPDRRILVRYDDRLLAAFRPPSGEDPDRWAAFILAIDKELGTVSPLLRRASPEKTYEALFDAALSKLDMFSRYAGADEAKDHRAARNGFGGIGVRYDMSGEGLTLIEVVPDGPAARAGLRVGDRIVAVEGTAITGLAAREIAHMLRGPTGTLVKVALRRQGGELFTASIKRGLIIPSTVALSYRDGIAVIAISSFNQGTAKAVESVIREAKAQPNFKGIVLDLRGNPGGLLDQGVAVAGLFMDRGRIVSTKGRNPASVQSFNAQNGGVGDDVRLVVLVDGKSASAAEIVAAALQDSGRAAVVGTNTYGKGTVQTIIRLPNDGEMTLTWSRYFSPSGYALHGLGVFPTVCTADQERQPSDFLGALENGRDRIVPTLAAWRSVGVDEAETRRDLRSRCPAAPHQDAAADMETARLLLVQPALMQKALALSAAQSASSALASFSLPGGDGTPLPSH